MAGEDDNSTGTDGDVDTDVTGGDNGDDAGRDDGNGHRDDSDRSRGQQNNDGRGDQDRTFTQTDVEKIVADRLARERKKFAGHDDLKKKAAQFDQLQEKNKTDLEKVNDQLSAAHVELQGYRVADIRRAAASKVGLDLELAEFITAVDEDEAEEQAKKLLARLGPKNDDDGGNGNDGNSNQAGRRSGADFKQGTRRGPSQKEMTRDDLIRGLAGFART